jgi:PIN domain nuclease of toxin-antitoxin system
VRALIDTHALLWRLTDDDRLTARQREVIAEASNDILASAVTVAETAIKTSPGKVTAPEDLLEVIAQTRRASQFPESRYRR